MNYQWLALGALVIVAALCLIQTAAGILKDTLEARETRPGERPAAWWLRGGR